MTWTLYLDFQVGRQILCTVTGAHLAQCTDHIQSRRALVLVGRSARNGYGWMMSFWLSLSSIMHWTKRTTLGLLPQNRYSVCFAHLTWCKKLKAACYICYIFSITPASSELCFLSTLPTFFVWLVVFTELNSFSSCPHCFTKWLCCMNRVTDLWRAEWVRSKFGAWGDPVLMSNKLSSNIEKTCFRSNDGRYDNMSLQ